MFWGNTAPVDFLGKRLCVKMKAAAIAHCNIEVGTEISPWVKPLAGQLESLSMGRYPVRSVFPNCFFWFFCLAAGMGRVASPCSNKIQRGHMFASDVCICLPASTEKHTLIILHVYLYPCFKSDCQGWELLVTLCSCEGNLTRELCFGGCFINGPTCDSSHVGVGFIPGIAHVHASGPVQSRTTSCVPPGPCPTAVTWFNGREVNPHIITRCACLANPKEWWNEWISEELGIITGFWNEICCQVRQAQETWDRWLIERPWAIDKMWNRTRSSITHLSALHVGLWIWGCIICKS